MAEFDMTTTNNKYLSGAGLAKLVEEIKKAFDAFEIGLTPDQIASLGELANSGITDLVKKDDLKVYALQSSLDTLINFVKGSPEKTLGTTDKTSIIAAINELVTNLGKVEAAIGTGEGSEGSITDRLDDVEGRLEDVEELFDDYTTTEELESKLESYAETADLVGVIKDVAVASDGYDAVDKTVTLELTKFDNSTEDLTIDLSSLFASAITVDQFLDDVKLNGSSLTFTFAVKEGDEKAKTDITIDLAEYIKPYDVDNTNNNGVTLSLDKSSNKISAALSADVLAKLAKADKLDADKTYVTTDSLEKTLEDYDTAAVADTKYVKVDDAFTQDDADELYVKSADFEILSTTEVENIWKSIFEAED